MLIDKSITEFLNELKSDAPTPGGGGVAALTAANGVALIMMTANLTISVEKYAEWHDLCRYVIAEVEPILEQLKKDIDADADQFSKLITAYRSKDDATIGAAAIDAATVPLEVMKLSVIALGHCQSLLHKSNPNLESDLHVAALCLRAAIMSAKYNVDENLHGMCNVDEELADEYRSKSEEYLEQGTTLSREILETR